MSTTYQVGDGGWDLAIDDAVGLGRDAGRGFLLLDSGMAQSTQSVPVRGMYVLQASHQHLAGILKTMGLRVLVIDNYDSFTYNLVQYLGELGAEPIVFRNDALTPAEADGLAPDRLLISPGPGRPEDAGQSIDFIRSLGSRIPTLGVCLGHQAIARAFGGKVDLAPEPKHGKTSTIRHDGSGLFNGLENPFTATRYHSLATIDLPDELVACAWSIEDDVVQGLRHRTLPISGVQFHPESIMTTEGKALLANFLG